ncbi:hypothetical protein HDU86_000899 [Geranomyces michiganensis]|nr:hypothetical protein HDU86_000899 [Geranomyces michiganensis]
MWVKFISCILLSSCLVEAFKFDNVIGSYISHDIPYDLASPFGNRQTLQVEVTCNGSVSTYGTILSYGNLVISDPGRISFLLADQYIDTGIALVTGVSYMFTVSVAKDPYVSIVNSNTSSMVYKTGILNRYVLTPIPDIPAIRSGYPIPLTGDVSVHVIGTSSQGSRSFDRELDMFEKFDNRRMLTKAPYTLTVGSAAECGYMCLDRKIRPDFDCISFDYYSDTRTCNLYDMYPMEEYTTDLSMFDINLTNEFQGPTYDHYELNLVGMTEQYGYRNKELEKKYSDKHGVSSVLADHVISNNDIRQLEVGLIRNDIRQGINKATHAIRHDIYTRSKEIVSSSKIIAMDLAGGLDQVGKNLDTMSTSMIAGFQNMYQVLKEQSEAALDIAKSKTESVQQLFDTFHTMLDQRQTSVKTTQESMKKLTEKLNSRMTCIQGGGSVLSGLSIVGSSGLATSGMKAYGDISKAKDTKKIDSEAADLKKSNEIDNSIAAGELQDKYGMSSFTSNKLVARKESAETDPDRQPITAAAEKRAKAVEQGTTRIDKGVLASTDAAKLADSIVASKGVSNIPDDTRVSVDTTGYDLATIRSDLGKTYPGETAAQTQELDIATNALKVAKDACELVAGSIPIFGAVAKAACVLLGIASDLISLARKLAAMAYTLKMLPILLALTDDTGVDSINSAVSSSASQLDSVITSLSKIESVYDIQQKFDAASDSIKTSVCGTKKDLVAPALKACGIDIDSDVCTFPDSLTQMKSLSLEIRDLKIHLATIATELKIAKAESARYQTLSSQIDQLKPSFTGISYVGISSKLSADMDPDTLISAYDGQAILETASITISDSFVTSMQTTILKVCDALLYESPGMYFNYMQQTCMSMHRPIGNISPSDIYKVINNVVQSDRDFILRRARQDGAVLSRVIYLSRDDTIKFINGGTISMSMYDTTLFGPYDNIVVRGVVPILVRLSTTSYSVVEITDKDWILHINGNIGGPYIKQYDNHLYAFDGESRDLSVAYRTRTPNGCDIPEAVDFGDSTFCLLTAPSWFGMVNLDSSGDNIERWNVSPFAKYEYAIDKSKTPGDLIDYMRNMTVTDGTVRLALAYILTSLS